MTRQRPEHNLQREVIALLKLALLPSAVVFHAANEGRRSLANGRALKEIGLLPGLPDIGIVVSGCVWWLELKSRRGRVNDRQRQCHTMLEAAGSPVAVVRSIDEVMDAIEGWGIANGHCRIAGRVPMTSTLAEVLQR